MMKRRNHSLPKPSANPGRLVGLALVAALAGGLASAAWAQAPAPRDGERMGPRHAAMHGHGGPAERMGPMMGGQFSGRALDAVGASAEQKAKLREIMQAARKDLDGQREAQRNLHGEMAKLLAAPQIDAAAAEALRQKIHAGHEAASKRMLQARLDAAAVLSAEQRQKLAELAAQHRGRMSHPPGQRGGRGPGAPDGAPPAPRS